MHYDGVTLVRNMASGPGDSGGAVFAGNGSPYSAVGIHVASSGPRNSDGSCPDPDLCFSWFFKWSSIEARLGLGPLRPETTQ
jgi:hypothetical protein